MFRIRASALRKRSSILLAALIVAETVLPGFAFAAPPSFSATQTVANAAEIQAVETVQVPRFLESGDTVSLTISGTTVTQSYQIGHNATMSALASLASGIPNVSATFDQPNNRLVFDMSMPNPVPVRLVIDRSPTAPVPVVANVVAVAQVARVDVPQTLIPGDVLSIGIDGSGTVVAYSWSDAGTISALAAAIDALPQVSATADIPGRSVTVTASVAGNAFALSNLEIVSSDVPATPIIDNVVPVAQVEEIALARPLYSGESVALTVSGVTLSQSFTGDTASTMTAFASQIDQLEAVTASYAGGKLTVTSATPGVPFTLSDLSVTGAALPSLTVVQNNVAVAQRDAIVFPRETVAGDSVRLTLNSILLVQSFTGSHVATMSGLIDQIGNLGNLSASYDDALDVLTVDSTVPGTPFTVGNAELVTNLASSNSVANVVAIAQVSSVTFPRDFVAGDTVSVSLNGNTVTSTYSGSHADTVEDLRSKMDATPGVSVLASPVTRVFTVTADVAGTPFSISSAALENSASPSVLQNNVVAVSQTSRITAVPTFLSTGTASLAVSGTTVSATFDTDDATTASKFVADIDALPGVSASWDSGTRAITLVSETPGDSFTVGNLSMDAGNVASSVLTGAVSETKATATVTVQSVPASPEVLTVGDCSVTLSGGVAIDASSSDCSDGAAEIDTDSVSSVLTLAQLLRGIAGYSYSGGVALSVSGTGADVVLTRVSSQIGSDPIPVTVASANFSYLANSPSEAVAQSSSVAFPRGVVAGDTVGVVIDSVQYFQNIGSDASGDFSNFVTNLSNLADFDASGDFSAGTVTLVSSNPGTSFSLTGTLSHVSPSQTAVSAVTAVAQKSAFTLPALPASGDVLSLILDGTTVSQAFDTDVATTFSGWLSGINAVGSANATLSGSQTVVLEASTPGTPFTLGTVQMRNTALPATETWNVSAVAQTDTLTVPFVPVSGDVLSVTVGTGTATQAFVSDSDTTLSLLNAGIEALGAVDSSVDLPNRTFTLRAKTAGTPFSASLAVTGATFSSSNVTPNEVDVAQVEVLSAARVFAVGDTVSVSVAGSGTSVAFNADSDTTAADVNAWIDSLPEVTSSLAGSAGNYVFTITSSVPGVAFTWASLSVATVTAAVNAQPNVVAVAQVTEIAVPRNLVSGDSLAVSLSGSSQVTASFSGSEADTMSEFVASLDALPEVSAVVSGLTVTLTASVPGVPFTLLPLSLSGSVPTTVTVNNVVPVAQVDSVTVPALYAGDTLSVTLDGVPVNVPYAGSEAGTLAAFASALAASGTVSASVSGSVVTVTAVTAGIPFSLGSLQISNVTDALVNVTYSAPVAQVVRFDVASASEGWTFRLTLNGKDYDYLAGSGDTDGSVESALAGQILADTGSVAVSTGATDFALTASVPGTPFSYSVAVVDVTAPVVTTPVAASQILKSGDVSTSTVASNEDGTIYAVASGTLAVTVSDLMAAVLAGNAFVVTGNALRDTEYAVTVPVGVNDGAYDFVAADAYGNVSNPALGWLTVDNTPPLLIISTVSGQSVHAVSMTVTGVTEANAVVTVAGSASLSGSADASGNFSVDLPLVADSLNSFTFSVTDGVGNVTTRPFSVTEDGIGPAIVANLSGVSYASGTTVSLTGQTEPNLPVVVSETLSGTVVSTVADGSGYYVATLPLRFDSSNDFTVTATDAASNTGTVSFTVVQDNVDPVVVIDPLPAVVDADTAIVSGTTESNLALTVSDGTFSTGAVADGSGAFSVTVGLVQNANNVFTVTVSDLSGRTGTASVNVMEDSVANSLVVSTLPATVNADSLTVTGTTKPNASMSVSGGAAALTGAADASGNWLFDVPLAQDSANALVFQSVDALGAVATGSLSVVEDSTFPTVVLSTVDHTTYSLTVPVSGTTEAFAAVTVTGGSGSVTVVADSAGAFTANVDLVSGTGNVLTVTATDAAGNAGSATVTVTHDPVVVFLTLDQSGTYDQSGTSFVVSGVTKPGIPVSVAGGYANVSVTSDGSGSFSVSVTLNQNADNVLTVTATDATSASATGSVTVVHDGIAPSIAFGSVPAVTNGLTLTVTGTTEANAVLSVLDQSGTSYSGTADGSGSFSLTFPLAADTVNGFDFTATDAAGNFGTGSVAILQDSQAPAISPVTVSSAALGSTATASYSFTTGETADAVFHLGTGSNVQATLVASVPTAGLAHSGTVLGLSQGTAYYAYVTATDAAGNLSQSTVVSFLTVTTPVVPPTYGGGGSGGGGGGGGGGSIYVGGGLTPDNCPGGDYSSSYYDGSCGTKPVSSSGTTVSGTGTAAPATPPTVSQSGSVVPVKAPTTPVVTPAVPNRPPVRTPAVRPDSTESSLANRTPATPSEQSDPVRRPNDSSRSMIDVRSIPGFVADKFINVPHTVIIRSAPNFASKSVTYLPRNYPVTVVAYGKNWSMIRFDGVSGYVRTVFLRDRTGRDDNRTDPYLFNRLLTEDRSVDYRRIKIKHSIFVRSRPDADSKIKTWVYSGDDAFILDQVGQWSEIRTRSGIGYVKTKYLQK